MFPLIFKSNMLKFNDSSAAQELSTNFPQTFQEQLIYCYCTRSNPVWASLTTFLQEDTGFGCNGGEYFAPPQKKWIRRKSYLVCFQQSILKIYM
jgi:hypothetical protein